MGKHTVLYAAGHLHLPDPSESVCWPLEFLGLQRSSCSGLWVVQMPLSGPHEEPPERRTPTSQPTLAKPMRRGIRKH